MKSILLLLFTLVSIKLSAASAVVQSNKFRQISNDTTIQTEVTFDIKQIQNALGADVFIMIPAGIPKANDIKVTVKDLFGNMVFESHLEYFNQIIEVSFELDKGYYRLEIDAGETHFRKNITIH